MQFVFFFLVLSERSQVSVITLYFYEGSDCEWYPRHRQWQTDRQGHLVSCPGRRQLKSRFFCHSLLDKRNKFYSPEQINKFIIWREQVFILNKLKLEYKYILEHKLEYKWWISPIWISCFSLYRHNRVQAGLLSLLSI